MKYAILFGLLSTITTIIPAEDKRIIDLSRSTGSYQAEFTEFHEQHSYQADSPLLLINTTDQPEIENFHKVPQVPQIPTLRPFHLGGREFNQENLKNASSEDINKLLAMAYPSIVERCYGKNNQTITQTDLQEIDLMHEEIRADLQFKILSTQGSCCMSEERHCYDRFPTSYAHKGCMIGGALCFGGIVAGLIWGMCTNVPPHIYCKIFALKIFLPSMAPVPAGCVGGEITSCTCNRCCAEQEVWATTTSENKIN